MKKQRPRRIQLVTLGTVLLGACSNADLPKDRYAYKSRAECVQDWGETHCENPPTGGAGVAGGVAAYVLGPRFNSIVETPSGKHIWSGNAGTPAVHPDTGLPMRGAVNIARGGFGHSAAVSRSGGG